MRVAYSPLDSLRFDYRIARAELDDAKDLAELPAAAEGFEIVILRVDEDPDLVAAALAQLDGWTAFTADHLMYWEWTSDIAPELAMPEGLTIDRLASDGDIDDLVRSSFAGYRNHYRANPLLYGLDATEGYVEWTRSLQAEDHGSVSVMRSSDGTDIGFGLVDWSSDVPDIRLAAMRPEFQGQGLYRHLIGSICGDAVTMGRGVQISTQSTNVNVMRVWARLGFLPFRTTATYHLVRSDLLTRSP